MRKGYLLGLMVLLLGVAVMSGCSQQIPEVKSSQSAPQNLIVKGIVYASYYLPASSYFDNHRSNPVAGAVVTLNGTFETKTTLTDANGEYVFQNIKNGNYIVTATKEGYQAGTSDIYTNVGIFAASVSDGTIFTYDIDIYANPVMRSVTPTPNSTIETNAAFTIVFNKPIDVSTVRPYITASGIRTMAMGDTINVTTSWNADATILTITPNSPLLPNMNYALNLTSGSFPLIKDQSGYGLASSTSSSYGIPVMENGDVVINQTSGAYFNYKTSSGGTPAAPSNLILTIGSGSSGKYITSEAGTGADYADIFGAANMGLSWTSGTGEITGYKVYVSDDANDNFRQLPTNYTYNNYMDFTMANVLNALYGTTNIDPLGTTNYPMINQPLYFKVASFNGESESPSVETTAQDLIPPALNAIAWNSGVAIANLGYVLDNNDYLPPIKVSGDDNRAYLFFTEPIDPALISSYFVITNAGPTPRTVVSARLLKRSSSPLKSGIAQLSSSYSVVEIVADGSLRAGGGNAYSIKVLAGMLKDLAGNIPSLDQTTAALP